MTSDLSATALRDTVARVQKTLGDCDNHADLVCSSGDHHVDVGDLREVLTALARLQEERDAAKGHATVTLAISQDKIGLLNTANTRLHTEVDALRAEVSRLTTALQQAGNGGDRGVCECGHDFLDHCDRALAPECLPIAESCTCKEYRAARDGGTA